MTTRIAVVLASGLLGCAGGQRGAPPPAPVPPGVAQAPPRVIELEPMRIEVVADEHGKAAVVSFDARDLLDAGNAALAAGTPDLALARYDDLLREFPDSALAAPARFNAGLALEARGDLDGAVARYDAVVAGRARPADAVDAALRAGAVRAEQGRFAEALERFDRVLAVPALTEPTRLEAMARKGHALYDSRDLAGAEQVLSAAIAHYEAVMLKVPLEGNEFVGMAHFYLAEIPHRQFVELPIRLPDTQLQKDVEAKAGLVLIAQERYEDTIGFGNLWWATAAGFQIAAMQEEFWQALVTAPIPPELGADAAAVYVQEVRALARAHLEKALKVHQKNVELAEAYRRPTDWSERSRRRITEVAALIADDAAGEAPTPSPAGLGSASRDSAPRSPEAWVPPPAGW